MPIESVRFALIFSTDWISGTDYYWPLDDSANNVIAGTRTGMFYGTIGFEAAVNGRQAIAFDGTSSYAIVPGLMQTCVSDPSKCTNGVTYSMVLKLSPSLANTAGRKLYLLDIMGPGQNDAAGFYVYVNNGQLGVFFRSVYHTWHSIVTPTLGTWINLAFVWNEQSGLVIYINGQRKYEFIIFVGHNCAPNFNSSNFAMENNSLENCK